MEALIQRLLNSQEALMVRIEALHSEIISRDSELRRLIMAHERKADNVADQVVLKLQLL